MSYSLHVFETNYIQFNLQESSMVSQCEQHL